MVGLSGVANESKASLELDVPTESSDRAHSLAITIVAILRAIEPGKLPVDEPEHSLEAFPSIVSLYIRVVDPLLPLDEGSQIADERAPGPTRPGEYVPDGRGR